MKISVQAAHHCTQPHLQVACERLWRVLIWPSDMGEVVQRCCATPQWRFVLDQLRLLSQVSCTERTGRWEKAVKQRQRQVREGKAEAPPPPLHEMPSKKPPEDYQYPIITYHRTSVFTIMYQDIRCENPSLNILRPVALSGRAATQLTYLQQTKHTPVLYLFYTYNTD